MPPTEVAGPPLQEHRVDEGGEINWTQDERSPSPKWSTEALAEACKRKRIAYTETDVLESARALVVTAGEVARISVRAGLAEPEKVAAVAQALGYVALKHGKPIAFVAAESPRHDGIELELAIWSAHLLVRPKDWEQSRREALEVTRDAARASSMATDRTAVRLGVPVEVVELWERHRDATFDEAPRAWLAHP
jgi:hypothetical protein